jgi:hypothetical protein
MADFDWLGSLIGGAAGYFGNKGSSQTTTTSQQVSPEFQPLAKAVAGRGMELGNMPYSPFGYNRVSDFNPYQYAGFDMIANQANNSRLPQQAEAALGGVLGGGAQSPQMWNPYIGAQSNTGSMNPYMGASVSTGGNPWEGKTTNVGSNAYAGANPFLEQNIQRTLGDMTTSYNQNVAPTMAATAFRSGSFGNTGQQEMENQSRDMLQRNLGSTAANMRMQDYTTQQGLAEAALNRSVSTQLADYSRNAGLAEGGLNRSMQGQIADLSRNAGLYESAMQRAMTGSMADLSRSSGLYESGANRAMSGYQADMGRMMQGLNMAPSIYGMGYQPAQAMLGIGGTMQQQGQNVLNSMYSDWQDAQNWPFKTYDAMMAPFGRASGGQTTTRSPGGNAVAGLFGGAMLGNKMFGGGQNTGINEYGLPNWMMPQP